MGSAGSDWSAGTLSPDHKIPLLPSSSSSSSGGMGGGELRSGVMLRRAKSAEEAKELDIGGTAVLRRSRIVGGDEINAGMLRRAQSAEEAKELDVGGTVVLRRNKTVGGDKQTNAEEGRRHNRSVGVVEFSDGGGSANGVVMRRTKNPQGQRNRKSALHGDSILPVDPATPEISPLGDTNVQIISVSPEHKNSLANTSEGMVIESRAGKVLDLVKEFDEQESEPQQGGVNRLGHGGLSGGSTAHSGSSDDGSTVEQDSRKRKSKAFDMFEKSGIVIGMVSCYCSLYNTIKLCNAILMYYSITLSI